MLSGTDILIFTVLLVLSLGIGLYQSRTGGRQSTTAEFIHGDHKLRILPTLLSLVVSQQSAISVLYAPAEYYRWGTGMWFGTELVQALAILPLERLFIPMFYRLQVTSIYEYLGLRFENNVVRRLMSVFSVLGSVMYMATCVLGPSLAMDTMTGIGDTVGITLMVGCCTVYTALGGIKAVVWTDFFQGITMIIGLCILFFGGSSGISGIDKVFRTGAEEGRLFFANYDVDPRTRTTLWSGLSHGVLVGFSLYCFDQGTMQRLTSLPSLGAVRLVMALLVPSIVIYISLCYCVGATVFAFFAHHECDPFMASYIQSPNQLLPLFVKMYFSMRNGINGLFLAILYSASLSTISTGLSGAAANLWQDVFKSFFRNASDKKATLVNKVLVVCVAVCVTGFAFLALHMPGNLYQITSTLTSCIYGPRIAVFLLACTTRRFEWKGAITGLLVGTAITAWISVGSIFTSSTTSPLPSLGTTGCITLMNGTGFGNMQAFNTTVGNITQTGIPNNNKPQGIENLYAISFLWYRQIGFITTCIVGMITSELVHFTNKGRKPKVKSECIVSSKDIFGSEGCYCLPKQSSNDIHPNDKLSLQKLQGQCE